MTGFSCHSLIINNIQLWREWKPCLTLSPIIHTSESPPPTFTKADWLTYSSSINFLCLQSTQCLSKVPLTWPNQLLSNAVSSFTQQTDFVIVFQTHITLKVAIASTFWPVSDFIGVKNIQDSIRASCHLHLHLKGCKPTVRCHNPGQRMTVSLSMTSQISPVPTIPTHSEWMNEFTRLTE